MNKIFKPKKKCIFQTNFVLKKYFWFFFPVSHCLSNKKRPFFHIIFNNNNYNIREKRAKIIYSRKSGQGDNICMTERQI